MTEWYREVILETGRSGVFWLLIAFVVTFALTRGVTRRIRAKGRDAHEDDGGLIGDIHIGGVHVHHQVWGILLILVASLLEFAYRPDSPWLEILAAAFGAGAALTLDEFALWLHLDDVYWSEEGRKSVDAVVIAVCAGLVLLVGTTPFGVDESVNREGLTGVAVSVLVSIAFSVVCAVKGKPATAVFGLLIPVIALVGAVRLATPGSLWARRFYARRPRARERAQRRAEDRARRRERLRDVLGGAAGG